MGQASKEIAAKIAILEVLKKESALSQKGYMKYSDLFNAVDKTAKSRPTFNNYYLQLRRDQLVRATREGRETQIAITPDGELELVYLQLDRQMNRLHHPTKRDHEDLMRQLISAVDSQNDEEIKRLETHPANIRLAKFSKILIEAYSAFCKVHSNIPAGSIYVCVKDGKLEFLAEKYLTYLKEQEQNRQKSE